jgi:hypothetical protein
VFPGTLGSALSFGSPAVRSTTALIRGFASPPYDGFAFVGKGLPLATRTYNLRAREKSATENALDTGTSKR